MLELEVTVVERRTEAQDICSLTLSPSAGTELPSYEAGSHIDLQIGDGLVRQYSLCGDPADSSRWRICVLNDPRSRGGSRTLHERLHVGSRVRVSRPRNLFALETSASGPALLLAGGIGITPILAMAKALHGAGHPFELHYCTRTPERTAFLEEILNGPFSSKCNFYFSDQPGRQRLDAELVLAAASSSSHLYVCGPQGFINHVIETARSKGWTPDRIHKEHFAAAASAAEVVQGFDLQLARSGKTLHVPHDKTALQVLLDHGTPIGFSCESGVCGTCVTRVLDGIPQHLDSYLTDAEHAANDCFTPCCSRAMTPTLVIDL